MPKAKAASKKTATPKKLSTQMKHDVMLRMILTSLIVTLPASLEADDVVWLKEQGTLIFCDTFVLFSFDSHITSLPLQKTQKSASFE
jgi:hypothetical protein